MTAAAIPLLCMGHARYMCNLILNSCKLDTVDQEAEPQAHMAFHEDVTPKSARNQQFDVGNMAEQMAGHDCRLSTG